MRGGPDADAASDSAAADALAKALGENHDRFVGRWPRGSIARKPMRTSTAPSK
jgi:hypothetical protein